MTSDRKSLTARSLAALDDRASIETRPLDAIRVDLKALGIDPEASIGLARQRALERSRPADRLLARLDEGRALDAEIEALEKADIADVRGNVQAGAAASIAGDAQRRAGLPSNVTAFKRRGRRFWGWGGSMVGIAACLLLFVVTRPDQLYRIEQAAIETADDVASLSKATTAEEGELDETFKMSAETQLAERAEEADRVVALAQPEKRAERSRMSAPDAELAVSNLTSGAMNRGDTLDQTAATVRPSAKLREQSGDKEIAVAAAVPTPAPAAPTHAPKASHLPIARPALPAVDPEEDRIFAPAEEFETPMEATDTVKAEVVDNLAQADDRNNLLAMLIVDPARVPAKFKSKAATLPEGNLADRLDEARTLIGSRAVVALVTLRQEGQTVDAVIAMPAQKMEPMSLTDSRAGFTSGASLAPSDLENDGGFELIELPRRP